MTKRLRELEAQLASEGGFHNIGLQLKIEGYKLCQENLAPVLKAARALDGSWHKSELRKALGDALAEVE